MRCSRCARACRADARFCDACGEALPRAAQPDDTPALAPIQRFVGRDRELEVIDRLLTRALSGDGGTAALAGEPGIGKTRTAERVAERASERGMQVLWGRCNEEPGAPPYWPWQQMAQAWMQSHDDDTVQRAVTRLASPLAEILPDIATRVSEPATDRVAGLPATEAAQARFRLFHAMSSFWKRAALEGPLLLVLDNLHWADASSLRLLEFLAPDLASSRILMLVTYRDIELSRQHPLSGTLGELARQQRFERLRLTGLTRADTARMTQLAGGAAFSTELVDAIHAQTEGNPLFVAEMTRLLLQEHSATRMPTSLRIPEGIKEVIGRRLNRLSATTNKVLAAAALIGRAFELRLLVHLLDDVDEDACGEAIEEALQAHVLQALREPGRYHFAHALFRETLYDEIPPPRRSRLHLKLARAIESVHGDDLEPHWSALAHHLWAALPGGDPARAVEVAQRAAERADRQLAHEEAARSYQLALQAMDAGSGFTREARCKLLNSLGDARCRSGEYLQALQVFHEAARASAECGSAHELARAALGYETACWCPGLPGGPAATLLREALAALGGGEPKLVAQLLSALARALIFSGEEDTAMTVHEEAIEVARRAGDPATLAETLIATLSLRWRHDRIAQRIAAAEEAYQLASQAGERMLKLSVSAWRLFDDFELGDMAKWHEHLEEYERGADEFRQPFLRYVATSSRAMHALFEGRFPDAEQLARDTFEIGRRMPGLDAAGVYGVQMFTLRREQGRLGEVAPLVEQFVGTAAKRMVWRPGLALMYVELGRTDAARAEFDALAQENFAAIARDGARIASLTYMAIVCHALQDAARARTLMNLLEPYSGRNLMAGTSIACFGAADGVLGLLASTMRDVPLAAKHFEAAISMNRRQGARPALARTCWHFARLLQQTGDAKDADRAEELLTMAEHEANALGMGALAEAIRLHRSTCPAPARLPAGLSPREAQVLRLVALGKGNRQIASELFVSPNTVANHVRSILGKTRSANRTEAAAFAIRNALL